MKPVTRKFPFRSFPVYRDSRHFVRALKYLTRKKFPQHEWFELRSQLWRALDSILLNITEGSDRGTDKDFAHFLNQSHTSVNEVVSCLDIALDSGYLNDQEHQTWLEGAEGIANQPTAFRNALLQYSQRSIVRGKGSH